MPTRRTTITCLLIAGIIANGCRSADPNAIWGSKVAEFRPDWKPQEKQTPASATYVLWAWDNIPRTVTGSDNRPAPLKPGEPWEQAHEMRRAYLKRGTPIGFRRVNGQLIGVTGPTTMPLALAHYTWRMLPGDRSDESIARDNLIFVAVVIVGVVCVVVAVGFIAHKNRHNLWQDVFDSSDSN